MLRRRIQNLRIVRREHDRERPLPPFLQLARRHARKKQRINLNIPRIPAAPVVFRQQRALASRIKQIRIRRMRRDIPALSAAHRVQPAPRRTPRIARIPLVLARHAQRRVVLLCPAHVIRHVFRRRHVIQLRRRVILRRPRLPAVQRNVRPAVVAVDHPQTVIRIDPQIVVIPVRRLQRLIRLPPVRRLEKRRIHHINQILHLRIRVNARIIKGALPHLPVVAHLRPLRAAVVGRINPAVFRLHNRVNPVAVRARNRHPDLPDDPRRQPLVPRNLLPRIAAVRALVKPAVRPPA